ncbi:hypothetical protein ABZ460_41855, partial [Streptomyces fagopyri]
MPYSIAQGKDFADVPNRRGESCLRNINGTTPTTGSGSAPALNTAFDAGFPRDVLAEQGTPGGSVEHGSTDAMFGNPQDPRTTDYVNGRFGQDGAGRREAAPAGPGSG